VRESRIFEGVSARQHFQFPKSRNSLTLSRAMLMDAVVAARLNADPPLALAAGTRTKMVTWPKILGLALLSGGTLMLGPVSEVPAATPAATLDTLPSDRAGEVADTVDLGSLKPISRPNREGGKPLPSGNPLWAVPLSVLTATQERPIFSASRRPPQRPVALPVQTNTPAPQKAAEPERPPLTLIGAVVGDGIAIAIFLDRTNQKIVRLRQGEAHAGWELNLVLRREVTLKKADRTEVLAFQRPDGPAGVSGAPGLVVPAAGGAEASYAPFTPRSTPKNGESDGL
jgi:general secretion pathway protein N